MDDRTTRRSLSRRGFLRRGSTIVAAGVVGGAAAATPALARRDEVVGLPWPWAKIDPLEAGRRAFRHYHDTGG